MDGDGTLDHWRWIVDTTDPCADNFDTNDRLGANFGGPNTNRPRHKGVDIQANIGDPVYGVLSGTVVWSSLSRNGLYLSPECGIAVRVETPHGYIVTYCHLLAANVTKGQAVGPSSLIGFVDSTGQSNGHHLHVALRRNNHLYEYFLFANTCPDAGHLNPGGC